MEIRTDLILIPCSASNRDMIVFHSVIHSTLKYCLRISLNLSVSTAIAKMGQGLSRIELQTISSSVAEI
jgi:hypothetical protein